MNKSFLKIIGVIATAAVAIAVCVIGFMVNNQRQQEQQVAYAATSIGNEEEKLTDLEQTIEAMYAKEKEYTFLKEGITKEEISKAQLKLEEIRTTAKDFKIKENKETIDFKELTTKKEELKGKLADVSTKFKVQKQISELFSTEIKSWQTVEKKLVIQDDLKENVTEETSKLVKQLPEDDWRKNMEAYLKVAVEQIKTGIDLQKKIEELLKNETVAQEEYDQILADIEKVQNKKLKEKLNGLAEQLAAKIIVPESSEEVIEESTEESEVYYEEVQDETIWTPPTSDNSTNGGTTGGGTTEETPVEEETTTEETGENTDTSSDTTGEITEEPEIAE